MADKMTCGRRAENAMDDADSPFVGAGRGLDHWSKDGTCSYCGSLSPDEFFRLLEAGEELEPTDKNYKAYVGRSKFYYQHLDESGKRKLIEMANAKAIHFGYPGHWYVLPFFVAR